jgi:hypothetical protein
MFCSFLFLVVRKLAPDRSIGRKKNLAMGRHLLERDLFSFELERLARHGVSKQLLENRVEGTMLLCRATNWECVAQCAGC